MYVFCKFPTDDPWDADRQLKSQFIQLRITIIYPAMLCPDFVRTIWRSDIELLSLQTSPHDLGTQIVERQSSKENCQLVNQMLRLRTYSLKHKTDDQNGDERIPFSSRMVCIIISCYLKEILKRRALFGNQTVVLLTSSGALTNSGASNPFFLKLL